MTTPKLFVLPLLPAALLCAALANTAAAQVVINEIHTAGYEESTDAERVFTENDWIELENRGSSAVALGGYMLTDSTDATTAWTFPPTTLEGGARLVVLATGEGVYDSVNNLLQTDFKLDNDGEYVGLLSPQGAVVSEVPGGFPTQIYGHSYGLAAGSDTYGFLQTPTPGEANGAALFAGKLGAPAFSHQRGFYDAPFSVTLTADDAEADIYYTTDGSWPTPEAGQLYTGPVPIDTTTALKAGVFRTGYLAGEVITHTYIFAADVLRQPKEPEGFPSVWGPEQVADYEMDPRVVDNRLYKDEIENDLKALPVISVVMDQSELFGAQGIWGNAEERGSAWERQTSVEFFSDDGSEEFHINAGIRMSGGAARGVNNPKHPFRLYFRSEYGDSKLEYPVFANGALFGETAVDEFDVLLLRGVMNFSWLQESDWFARGALYFRDLWTADSQLAMGHTSTHGRPVHVYLNGLYWGVYILQEQVDAEFVSDYLGGNEDEWDVVKHYLVDGQRNADTYEVKDGEAEAWERANELAKLDMSVDANYQQVAAYIDIENHIDYMLLNIYAANSDGVVIRETEGNNWYGARLREPGEGFKFISWDAEFALKNKEEDKSDMHGAYNPATFYAAFRQNAEWRLKFADRVQYHMLNGGPLSQEANTERFQYRADQLYSPIVAESARWGDYGRPQLPRTRRNDWERARDEVVNSFFPFRTNFVLDLFREDGLYPLTDPPVFSQHGGLVEWGREINMSNPNSGGTIYYTTDGSDPRLPGGAVASTATEFTDLLELRSPTLIRARVKNGSEWSAIVSAAFVLDQNYSDLRVTELMYHPAAYLALDEDELEFLELRNVGETVLRLEGAYFSDGIEFEFPAGFELQPGHFAVLVSNAEAFALKYPDVAVDGVYTGRLRNSGERLALSLADGQEVFAFSYLDEDPWPVEADGDGYSLVPVDSLATGDYSDASMWRISLEVDGSPGAPDGDDLPNPEDLGIAYFADPEANGEGWYHLDWFGHFNLERFPWVYHLQHGWIFALGEGGAGGFWLYDMGLGWTYWSESLNGWLFMLSHRQWAFYQEGSVDPRWFYLPLRDEWVPEDQIEE